MAVRVPTKIKLPDEYCIYSKYIHQMKSIFIQWFCFIFPFMYFLRQQVDEKYIKNIHLHSGGSSGSALSGKNSHRSKTSTNSQSRDKHETSAIAHIRSYASPMSLSSMSSAVDWSRGKWYLSISIGICYSFVFFILHIFPSFFVHIFSLLVFLFFDGSRFDVLDLGIVLLKN